MRKAAIIALGLLLSINSLAQGTRRSTKGASLRVKSSATMPTVDAVLEKYVKAIGGKAALLKINSRFSKGTFEISSLAGVKGTLEVYEKAPNKQIATLTIPGVGTQAEGFDGTLAWALEPDSGVVHDKTGLELAAAKRDAEFYEEIKLRELYPRITLKGVEKVGAHEAFVVEAVPQVGSPERLYFDTQTGLLLRKDSEEEGEEGKRSIEEYYEDYRVVDGVKLPFTIHQVSPGMNFTVKLSEVKQNVSVDDSKFNKPEEQ
jgi:outer membrane lipoprotein-sorting protein